MTKEEEREYNRKYREANKERIAEKHKLWCSENKEKCNEYVRSHSHLYKERKKEYSKKYKSENKDKIKQDNAR